MNKKISTTHWSEQTCKNFSLQKLMDLNPLYFLKMLMMLLILERERYNICKTQLLRNQWISINQVGGLIKFFLIHFPHLHFFLGWGIKILLAWNPTHNLKCHSAPRFTVVQNLECLKDGYLILVQCQFLQNVYK